VITYSRRHLLSREPDPRMGRTEILAGGWDVGVTIAQRAVAGSLRSHLPIAEMGRRRAALDTRIDAILAPDDGGVGADFDGGAFHAGITVFNVG
jgi:hypothetical protein